MTWLDAFAILLVEHAIIVTLGVAIGVAFVCPFIRGVVEKGNRKLR